MPGPSNAPTRVLGPIDATCVVVGAIIGVGIFFNPQQVAELTRSAPLSLAAWAIAGGIALCGSLTFAALGARYHANGAQYQVLRDSYGPLPAFLFVFCNATAIQAGAVAVIAVLCARNLAAAAGRELPAGLPEVAASGALVLLLMAANIVGVKWGSRIQNLTVFAKVLTLLVITGLAAWVSRAPAPAAPVAAFAEKPDLHPVSALLAALVPCLFAYGGWQHALWISGEVKDPRRNLPRAIVGGVVLVVAVYLLANWAYLELLGVERVRTAKTLAADAVATVWPQWGSRMIAAAVGVSAFGVLNAQLLSGPRLVFGMARDGRFFESFGRLSPRFATPVSAIVLIAGMALVLLLVTGLTGSQTVELLTTGTVFIDGVFFVLTGAAVFVLRKRAGETLRVRGYPLTPALFVLGEVGVVVGAHLTPGVLLATLVGVAWIVLAAVLYMIRFRSNP
ncbi:Serine/threonine exchanger SteT [Phycisphaerales bacterium]|nr:Serine/threonine exchanger SteT [Phycisphaerales bacterium]